MIDDLEGDVQEAPADSAPSSEPPSEPGEIVSSDDVRAAIQTQRERGPDGKFVKSEASSDQSAARGIATGAGETPKSATVPERGAIPAVPVAAEKSDSPRPPPGFSVATVQAWDSLPEHVKADIAKREIEINGSMQRYGGLKQFAEEAERNGTTLQAAVADYVAVENEISKDFPSGVAYLCARWAAKIGVHPRALLNAVIQRFGGQQGNGQQQPAQPPQIDPNAIVAQATQAVRSEFQARELNAQIEAFSANPVNKFFPNVRQDMALLVQAGKAEDLQTAYEAACWLHPEIRAILLDEMRTGNKGAARTAARAQNAAKAVTGAPASGQPTEPPRRRDLSLDDEIRAAINAQRGAA